ncbi:hypothetical protein HNR50_001598 [Spirochaeta isovalerica]|uniref:Uncharacterized protein n=1 Tax=Spirochaeta isovalerica TaxID=150 RepID=A0A841RA99_9SPIO|nr:hypothetical protein [Spirochaeta isovalerica]
MIIVTPAGLAFPIVTKYLINSLLIDISLYNIIGLYGF